MDGHDSKFFSNLFKQIQLYNVSVDFEYYYNTEDIYYEPGRHQTQPDIDTFKIEPDFKLRRQFTCK